jgi:hypothetical protein
MEHLFCTLEGRNEARNCRADLPYDVSYYVKEHRKGTKLDIETGWERIYSSTSATLLFKNEAPGLTPSRRSRPVNIRIALVPSV